MNTTALVRHVWVQLMSPGKNAGSPSRDPTTPGPWATTPGPTPAFLPPRPHIEMVFQPDEVSCCGL